MTSGEHMTYADTGVDVDIEALAANILFKHSKASWPNRQDQLGEVIVPFDDFSGLRYYEVGELPKGTVSYGGSDSIATKAELIEQAEVFGTAAQDLLAMVCDDAVIRGAEPVAVKSHLRLNTLGKDTSRLPIIEELAGGYSAASMASVGIINGEISQENDRMGDLDRFKFDWTGDVTWFAHKSRLITGFDVKPGDYLIGMREEGLRCNGISLVRTLLPRGYGTNWQEQLLNGERLIDLAIRPSRIYSNAIVDMTGGWSLDRPARAKINALAHVTGGGIPEKLGRILRATGYGAFVDEPFEPNPLMLVCQEIGNVTDRESYNTWHMGPGMIGIGPEPQDIIYVAAKHGIEARVIGRIEEKPGVRIRSLGHFSAGQILEYLPKAA